MAMETVLALALAMGRTLVLPPEQGMYLLNKAKNQHHGKQQRDDFSYNHFFHTDHISQEHEGLKIITMKQFLEREAVTGNLKDVGTGEVLYPPNNTSDFDGDDNRAERKLLQQYLRRVGLIPKGWDPDECLAAFPSSTDPSNVEELHQTVQDIRDSEGGFGHYEQFVGKPTDVDGTTHDRLKELWADRKDVCVYTQELQNTPVLHFAHGQDDAGARLLVHFYAFLFFQDWRQDLWMKRFVRDHVRYVDEIQCAAATVVNAIREHVRNERGDESGEFDVIHVRRGDFQFKPVKIPAEQILKNVAPELAPNSTLYIATDERDKSFFAPFKEKYHVLFLDDFHDLIKDVNTNYYGMMDQLIASRGRIFFGCWFSTFTGYINRLRGYHANKAKGEGYELGHHRSYYYALLDRKYHLQQYWPVKKAFYAREFPASWRLIDGGVDELDYLYREEDKGNGADANSNADNEEEDVNNDDEGGNDDDDDDTNDDDSENNDDENGEENNEEKNDDKNDDEEEKNNDDGADNEKEDTPKKKAKKKVKKSKTQKKKEKKKKAAVKEDNEEEAESAPAEGETEEEAAQEENEEEVA